MKQIIFAVGLILVFSFSVFAQNENLVCPKIEVVGGGVINPGEPMNFSVKVGDEAKDLNLEYQWTASEGKIIEGQGTSSIKIDITGLANVNVTATIEIKGFPENCRNVSSETGSVVICYRSRLFDEYEKLPAGKIKAKVNELFVLLGSEPNYQGYIINYGTDKEITVLEKQIRDAITFLKYDANRVTVIRGGSNPNGEGVFTKVWIVPPGADNPQP
jgi:hypothetical protein